MINLTQHNTSKEQKQAGAVDLPAEDQVKLRELLTFNSLPTRREIIIRATEIALLAKKHNIDDTAMIGGAPFLMSTLEKELSHIGIESYYAFSKRVVEEQDGVKKSIFKHEGFVTASNFAAFE